MPGNLHHTLVPLKSPSEQRIIDLCHTVIELPENSIEFEQSIRELQSAIHEILENARTRMTNLALIVASREDAGTKTDPSAS